MQQQRGHRSVEAWGGVKNRTEPTDVSVHPTVIEFIQLESAGKNLATFRPLWKWALERLCSRPGGYALDLDSTRLLHEDGHQEGVAVCYTRLGTKP